MLSFFQVLETTVVLLLVFTVSEALRRLYFHPLAHIPGPKLAALTWWYEFYFDGIQQGRYVFKIQELHKQYGPIIRVTPDEIHINDVGFIDAVYASSKSQRDKYNYQLRALRVPGGVGTTASYDVHKRRREVLSPFFSKRNVLYLEPLIIAKVEQFCGLAEKHATENTVMNLSDAFFAFSNDVATNFLFAHQANVLADEVKAAKLRHNSNELLMGINVNKHFPWFPDFLESLPLSISKPFMPPGLIDLLALFERVRTEVLTIKKLKSSESPSENLPGQTGKESVYASVLDSTLLPTSEKSLMRLEQEGALLVLAGAESPAKSLNIIFYHLLANPSILSKVRAELSTIPVPISWTKLEQLPYLSAVLEEGNRLSFGVTARTARIAHEPLTYMPSSLVTPSPSGAESYTIPSGTPISITTLSAHTAESVFPNPFVFSPERWLGDAGRWRRKFQMAFSKGGRKCLGIELARAELYLLTAVLVKRFEMSLWETNETDIAFSHDYQVAMPQLDSKGVRVVVNRLRK